MYSIKEARYLAQDIKLFRIEAPRIASKRKAGQFVIVRAHSDGERIPLTIADSDLEAGTITIVVQGIGKTTKLINSLEEGDEIQDVVGPLGEPSDIQHFGTVVVIGGGVGTAIAYPTAVAMKNSGNKVIAIIGARTKELLILTEEMQQTTDQLFIFTDDGSAGEQGFVTQKLQELIDQGTQVDHVLAIGPIPMMNAVASLTRPHQIKTIVSLNPIMVDGTGMCGGCRVLIGGESKFACIDGPEFDAHDVDFTVLSQRNQMYKHREKKALEQFDSDSSSVVDNNHCHLHQRHPEVGPRKSQTTS